MRTSVGDILLIPAVSVDNDVYHEPRTDREWTVTEVYKNHVVAVSGVMRESFTFGQLIQLGYEKQSNRYETLKHSLHGSYGYARI